MYEDITTRKIINTLRHKRKSTGIDEIKKKSALQPVHHIGK